MARSTLRFAVTSRGLWIGVLVPIIGCADPGTLRGVPEFDAVASALWLDDEAGEHLLMLSDQPDACDAVQDAARLIATLDTSEHDDCASFQSAAAEIGAAYGPLMDEGAATLLLAFPGAPEEGSYATADADGEDSGPLFSADLYLFQGSPWEWAATGYACGDPDPVSEYLGDLVETRGVTSATLDVESVSARAMDMYLEGVLVQDNSGDLEETGAISVDAHLSRCAVETVGDPLLEAL